MEGALRLPATVHQSVVATILSQREGYVSKDRGLGESPDIPMFDFMEFCRLIGFEEVWAFEKRWAK